MGVDKGRRPEPGRRVERDVGVRGLAAAAAPRRLFVGVRSAVARQPFSGDVARAFGGRVPYRVLPAVETPGLSGRCATRQDGLAKAHGKRTGPVLVRLGRGRRSRLLKAGDPMLYRPGSLCYTVGSVVAVSEGRRTVPRRSNVHVSKDGSAWKVTRAGSRISSHRTQATAIQAGKRTARQGAVDLVIHGRDGRIRSKDSYGRDPHPPRDREH